MINLKAIYGKKIFDRKAAYRNVRYIPFLAGLFLDLATAGTIVWVFDVKWEYAFIKVYGILVIFDVLKYIISSSIDFLNYKLFIKDAMASEIKHYLSVFNSSINWHDIGTYDDFLLEVSFNKTLTDDLRVLAAINYGVVVGTMRLSAQFENRCYSLFNQIAPDFIPRHEREHNSHRH